MVAFQLILRWGATVGYPDGPDIIMKAPKSGRGGSEGGVTMERWSQRCNGARRLQEEEGARSQRMWVTSGSWKRQGNLFPQTRQQEHSPGTPGS